MLRYLFHIKLYLINHPSYFHQTVVYDLLRRMLGSGPVYAALGNHDSFNQSVAVCTFGAHHLYFYLRAQDAPHSLGGELAEQFSWYVIIIKYHSLSSLILFIGITIMSLASGSMSNGYRTLLLSLHDLTTQLTQSNVWTDCVSSR